MAIRILIDRVVNTNLKKKSVIVRLSNTQPELAYRQLEIILSREIDEVAYVSSLMVKELREMWEQAKPIDADRYKETEQKASSIPFYEMVTASVDSFQKMGVSEAYTAIMGLLDDNTEIKGQLLLIFRNLGLEPSKETMRQREQLLWLLVLSLINLEKDDN